VSNNIIYFPIRQLNSTRILEELTSSRRLSMTSTLQWQQFLSLLKQVKMELYREICD